MDNITVVLAPFPLARPTTAAEEDSNMTQAGLVADAGQYSAEHA
jgi:hypothetical protein